MSSQVRTDTLWSTPYYWWRCHSRCATLIATAFSHFDEVGWPRGHGSARCSHDRSATPRRPASQIGRATRRPRCVSSVCPLACAAAWFQIWRYIPRYALQSELHPCASATTILAQQHCLNCWMSLKGIGTRSIRGGGGELEKFKILTYIWI